MTTGTVSLRKYEWDNLDILLLAEAVILVPTAIFLFAISADPVFQSAGNYLQNLLWLAFFVFIFEMLRRTNPFFESVGFGKSVPRFLMAIGAGIGVAFLLRIGIFGDFSIIVPQAVLTSGQFNLLVIGFFAFLFEETAFRATILPTLVKWFNYLKFGLFSTPLGILISSIMFGITHAATVGLALNFNIFSSPLIIFSILFGIIAGVGNGMFKSTGFSYAMHATHNILFILAVGVM